MVSNLWHEKDGVVYLSVVSDGCTGSQWVRRLGKKKLQSDRARSILCSPDFKSTSGVKYEIAVLKGMLFENRNRITSNIRNLAMQRKLTTPNTEVACLILENFSNVDFGKMGLLRIVVMHEPIKDFLRNQSLLRVSRAGNACRLYAYYDTGHKWCGENGFAFVVSQTPVSGS
ncbi:MAG: hypothetical protein WCO84_05185 [bacterium]